MLMNDVTSMVRGIVAMLLVMFPFRLSTVLRFGFQCPTLHQIPTGSSVESCLETRVAKAESQADGNGGNQAYREAPCQNGKVHSVAKFRFY
jgi:hypothetical protein